MARTPAALQAVLAEPSLASEVAEGVWSVSGGAQDAQYDSIGGDYHVVGGMDLYHRVFWGVSTREYREFAGRATAAGAGGMLLDAGCGSMLFSAEAHLQSADGGVIGVDASLEMLKRARQRLGGDSRPGRVILLHSDVVHSSFRAAIFDSVVCLHVAHVLDGLPGLVGELHRVLKPGGKLFLTSVVLAGTWRDRYLRTLARRGIMASPRRVEEIVETVQAVFQSAPERRLSGSMLFVEACKLQG